MGGLAVITASLVFLSGLFVVARRSDRRGAGRHSTLVYVLGLGVYCTSWTFYGAVGEAANAGFDFTAIYLGPILLLALGRRFLERVVRVAQAANVTSISDLVAARYGKSHGLAALVTVTAVIGLLPYFALQLKAIGTSFALLSGGAAGGPANRAVIGSVALCLAIFAAQFGVRSANAAEPHRGLMTAIAAESVLKLAAALLVGAAICFFALDPGILWDRLHQSVELRALLDFDPWRPSFWAVTALSALAFLCLPRQFHALVLENRDPDDVRRAAWAFPLYLVAISLFVLPVALVGRIVADPSLPPDAFMVGVPQQMGWHALGVVAFLGGLSAATSMIILEMLALGTMVSNDLLLPLLRRVPRIRDRLADRPQAVVPVLRRCAIVATMALAYGFHLGIAQSVRLTEIGLISFAAVAQFAPAVIGGFVWRGGSARGAAAGIAVGFAGWAVTIVAPVAGAADWLATLPGAEVVWLPPPDGTSGERILHGLAFSLLPNALVFWLVSRLRPAGALEREDAARFLGQGRASGRHSIRPPADPNVLRILAERYVGAERAASAFAPLERGGLRADEAAATTERLLAGTIGAASARVVMAGLTPPGPLSSHEARSLIGEASKAILSRHEIMHDTLEQVPQGICAFDAQLRVQLWNRRFLDLGGFPEDLIEVGAPLARIVEFNEERGEYTVGSTSDTMLARWSAARATGGASVYERLRPDGTVLEVSLSPFAHGGFVAVYTDVTARHRAAQALRLANETLEDRVRERTRALARATAEAERANAGKTRFLAAAGHDLMQPLQAARLFAAALGERVRDPAVGQIDAALHSVEHILGELHEVSKLDSGVVRATPVAFRVEDVLRPLAEEFALLARQHGLALRFVPCRCAVRSDPALLRRIVQNFLVNAVRYTAQGAILLGCRRRGGALSIEVIDTGPGIPEDRRREIFLEFHRLEGTPSDRGQGLGLGLAIVDRLAELLHHPLDVRSRLGRGSAFSVRVPLAEMPQAETAPDPAIAPRSGARILFVDNEAAIATAMQDLLENWSYDVLAVSDPDAALASLATRPPDVILSDYHLDHGLTGLDLLDRVAAALGRPAPAAILTADRDPAIVRATTAAGARIIHKPVRPGALRALLAQLVAESRES